MVASDQLFGELEAGKPASLVRRDLRRRGEGRIVGQSSRQRGGEDQYADHNESRDRELDQPLHATSMR